MYTPYDYAFIIVLFIAQITLSSLHPPLVCLLIHYAIFIHAATDIVIVMGFLSKITSPIIIMYIDIHGSQYQYNYDDYTPATVLCYYTCSICHCLPVCYQAMLLGMSL